METRADRRRRKLGWLCKEHGIEAVASRAGVSSESLDQILKGVLLPPKRDGSRSPRALGDAVAARIEVAFSLGRGWFDTDDGFDDFEAVPAPPSIERREISQAHPVSHLQPIVLPKPIGWERLMDKELPERFSLIVRDDAMAPELCVGHQALFSTEREPGPGRVVLLADRDGHTYIRDYQLRRPGHWQAVARNAAYQPLDSITEGLRVLAVQIGALWG